MNVVGYHRAGKPTTYKTNRVQTTSSRGNKSGATHVGDQADTSLDPLGTGQTLRPSWGHKNENTNHRRRTRPPSCDGAFSCTSGQINCSLMHPSSLQSIPKAEHAAIHVSTIFCLRNLRHDKDRSLTGAISPTHSRNTEPVPRGVRRVLWHLISSMMCCHVL